MRDSICQKHIRISDNILRFLIYLSAGISVGILIGIIGYVEVLVQLVGNFYQVLHLN